MADQNMVCKVSLILYYTANVSKCITFASSWGWQLCYMNDKCVVNVMLKIFEEKAVSKQKRIRECRMPILKKRASVSFWLEEAQRAVSFNLQKIKITQWCERAACTHPLALTFLCLNRMRNTRKLKTESHCIGDRSPEDKCYQYKSIFLRTLDSANWKDRGLEGGLNWDFFDI